MQIAQTFAPRGPRAPAGLFYVAVVAALLSPAVTLDTQDKSRRLQLCGERLTDAVLDLCDFKLFDPVEQSEIHVIDERRRPSVVASSGGGSRFPKVVRRSEVHRILNRRDSSGLGTKCCQTQCTIADMVRYCAADS